MMSTSEREAESHIFWDHDGTLAVDLCLAMNQMDLYSDEDLIRAQLAGGVLYHPDARDALLWSLENFDHCWWLSNRSGLKGAPGQPPSLSVVRHLSAGLQIEPELIAKIRIAPWERCKSEALRTLIQSPEQNWALIDDEPTPGLLRWLSEEGMAPHWVRCRAEPASKELRYLSSTCEARGLLTAARRLVQVAQSRVA